MPIVLSYEDVNALGTLAHQGAYAGARGAGEMQNRALTAQIEAGRDATATQLQAISSRERQAEADRGLRADIAAAGQDYRYDVLARDDEYARAEMESSLQQESIRAQAKVQSELMGELSQRERDQRLHQQRLIEIDRREGQGVGQLSTTGVPDPKYAKAEAQRFATEVPFDPAISPGTFQRGRERATQTAEALSGLSTDQLIAYGQSGQLGKEWQPYVEAIVQSRRQLVAPQEGAGQRGSSVPAGSGGFTEGKGFADPEFAGYNDQQINELLTDPMKLNRFLGGR